ncbi:MAG: hypothetical protein G8D61_05420 [gamma proteobacterium symbiont of Ctena orbiculata]
MKAPRGSTLTLLLITSTSSLCANSPLDSLSGPLSVTREQAADGGRPLQPGQKTVSRARRSHRLPLRCRRSIS